VLPPHEGPEPGYLGVLAVCSVHGLYRAFPPPDPPVYVRPKLKPSHGICCFTTTTFGAHCGADQGAGRSTSGWDLLHQLGGSTSASPSSIAGLLQLPGLTSTRPGRHTTVPDLHRHLRAGTRLPRAGIFMSRPTYVGPGSTSAFLGPAYNFPDRNMFFPGRYSRFRAGICQSRPLLAGIRDFWAKTGQSRLGRSPPTRLGCSAPPVPGLGRRVLPPAGLALPFPGLGRRRVSLLGCGSCNSAGPARGELRIPAGPAYLQLWSGPARVVPAGPGSLVGTRQL
jgi:hypothetical protein